MTSAEELRRGVLTQKQEGVYRPRAHVGDTTPETRRSLGLIGRGYGPWHEAVRAKKWLTKLLPQILVTPQESRFNVIDPANLGRMEALEEISVEDIISARKVRFKELWEQHDPPVGAVYDVENLEFDPIVIAIEAGSDAEMKLRNRVNQAVRDVTLAFAYGRNLEGIASRYPGGVPRLEGETDTAYRRRVWLSPNIFTPHGVAEAYIFWALTSNIAYRDASALTKPASGHIFIPVLINDPDQTPWVKAVGVAQNSWTRLITSNPIPTPPQRSSNV